MLGGVVTTPVGEVMDNELLIQYICDVAKKAEANLEFSKAGFLHFVVPDVRVIGEARLKSITLLVDKAIQKAKQIVDSNLWVRRAIFNLAVNSLVALNAVSFGA